jgi:hypothetical protein
MKFPSIESLANSLVNTLKRFPFEVLFALAGTIAATIYINSNAQALIDTSIYTRVIMMANLGLLLSLAATLYAESKGSNKKWPLAFFDLGQNLLHRLTGIFDQTKKENHADHYFILLCYLFPG